MPANAKQLAAIGIALGLCTSPALAGRLLCAVDYGGETKTLEIAPTRNPYSVPTHAIGSFFHFRVVFREQPADLAGIEIYTYADRDIGPLILHHASYPYPLSALPQGDFTGLQRVYEPLRDSELQYRCRIEEGKS